MDWWWVELKDDDSFNEACPTGKTVSSRAGVTQMAISEEKCEPEAWVGLGQVKSSSGPKRLE